MLPNTHNVTNDSYPQTKAKCRRMTSIHRHIDTELFGIRRQVRGETPRHNADVNCQRWINQKSHLSTSPTQSCVSSRALGAVISSRSMKRNTVIALRPVAL